MAKKKKKKKEEKEEKKEKKKKKGTSTQRKPVDKRRSKAIVKRKDGTTAYSVHPAGERYFERLEGGLTTATKVPDYDSLLERFSDHALASQEVAEILQSAEVVAAFVKPEGPHFPVFGLDLVRKAHEEPTDDLVTTIQVRNRDELQFLLSALVKYRGWHDFYCELDAPFEP